jgi:alkaline phosphatase D
MHTPALTLFTSALIATQVAASNAKPDAITPILHSQHNHHATTLDVIALGSCAREREPQPIWDEIIAHDPDLFLFIGDNHYADVFFVDGERVMAPIPNIGRLLEAYETLAAIPGFQRMREHAPMLGTWDDHDYGANDAGEEFYLKEQSQQVFLDFFGFSEDDPIRQQEGIYHAQTFGEPGRRVQVIMLDTRYHRSELETGPRSNWGGGPYIPSTDPSKTLLGEKQWQWLEAQLRQPADIRILASSIQVVADQHRFETWGNLPHERDRLYQLIDDTNANGLIVVSGDRHLIEISRDAERGAPYPIYDFTSSGLNETSRPVNDPNRFRVGPVVRDTNYGILRINWTDSLETTSIALEGYGSNGTLHTLHTVFLSELQQED